MMNWRTMMKIQMKLWTWKLITFRQKTLVEGMVGLDKWLCFVIMDHFILSTRTEQVVVVGGIEKDGMKKELKEEGMKMVEGRLTWSTLTHLIEMVVVTVVTVALLHLLLKSQTTIPIHVTELIGSIHSLRIFNFSILNEFYEISNNLLEKYLQFVRFIFIFQVVFFPKIFSNTKPV